MKHIRIISPSGVIDPRFIDDACSRLRAWGYIVSVGAHAREAFGRFAGRDEDRLSDIIAALEDKTVDFILCSRGGYGLQRIIDRIPKIEKPIIGFSDITALHQKAATNGCPTLHGIMCKHIASLPEDSEPIIALRKVLEGKLPEYTIPAHPLNREGEACGPVIGGNLSVLYGLQGTPYDLRSICDLRFKISNLKPILLIEDICERHYHIDRMIRNLKMSGVLSQLGGMIVGQFTECEDDPLMGCTVYETIKEVVAEYNYPILFDAPIGHVECNLPLWLGKSTEMNVRADSFCHLRQL